MSDGVFLKNPIPTNLEHYTMPSGFGRDASTLQRKACAQNTNVCSVRASQIATWIA